MTPLRRRITIAVSLAACLGVGVVIGWMALGAAIKVAVSPSEAPRGQVSFPIAEAPLVAGPVNPSGAFASRELVSAADMPRSSLVVECTYGKDMRPVAEVEVTVVRIDIDPPAVLPVAHTDGQGRVVFQELLPGTYQAQAAHESMVTLGSQAIVVTLDDREEDLARFAMARVYVGVLAFDGIDTPYDVRFDVGSRSYDDATAGSRSLGRIHARLLDEYGPFFRLFATADDIGSGASETFYLFFKDYKTQQVSVPLVPLSEFREPTRISRGSLALSASCAPKIMLRIVDPSGRIVDAGRWMLIRSAATSGLESVDVASNVWRHLPSGQYRVRGHAVYCPWVFASAETLSIDDGEQYEYVVAANAVHSSVSVAVKYRGVTTRGLQGRFVGLDALGSEHRGAWMDFSSARTVDLPVGPIRLELTYRGRAAVFEVVITDQERQDIAVDWVG